MDALAQHPTKIFLLLENRCPTRSFYVPNCQMADRKARIRAQASVAKRAPATPSRTAARAPDPHTLQPPPAPAQGRALVATEPPAPPRDAHGFDPNDYDWIPVKRTRRLGAWTDVLQRQFIEELAATCSVTEAAQAVGMSTTSCYRLRNAPDGEGFARAWDAAIHASAKQLVDALFDRALNGVEHVVYDRHGNRIGAHRRYDNRLAMQLIRAHLPERYARTERPRPGDPVPTPTTVGEALVALTPVTPPDPHLLMPPDRLATEIAVADVGEGELPRWHREPVPSLEPDGDPDFEARLEAWKHLGPKATERDMRRKLRENAQKRREDEASDACDEPSE